MAAVTTLGYAGILVGPALIGLVARATSLEVAFGIPLAAMLAIAASYGMGGRAR